MVKGMRRRLVIATAVTANGFSNCGGKVITKREYAEQIFVERKQLGEV